MKWKGALLAPLLVLSVPSISYGQFYVSTELGFANAEFSLGEPYNGIVDDNSLVFGVNVGFGVHENLAIQGTWHGYTSFDGRAAPCPPGEACPPPVQQIPTSGNDIRMWSLAAVPRITVGGADTFEFFGKAGYYTASVDTDIGLPGQGFTRRGFVLGGGVRWEVAEPWNIHVAATRFGDRVTQFTVGVGWQQVPFRARQGR